jgi:hypothetical protein
MSPGVNGSSLMPKEMTGKAAASGLNVATRRLLKAQSPGAEAEELAATGRSVRGGQLPRWGRWWNLRGTSQGAGLGGRDPGTKPGAADPAERLSGRTACRWTATPVPDPGNVGGGDSPRRSFTRGRWPDRCRARAGGAR